MFRLHKSRFAAVQTFQTQSNISSLSGPLPARFGDDNTTNSMMMMSNIMNSSNSNQSQFLAQKTLAASNHALGAHIDHLVIDASSLTSAALRLLKNETQLEREATRIVTSQAIQLIKRLQPKKSLVVLMDGSEGIWKADKARSKNKGGGATKKQEERMLRGPGSNLALAVETGLLNALPDRKHILSPPEIFFSGSCTSGSIETKTALWAANVAKRKVNDDSSSSGNVRRSFFSRKKHQQQQQQQAKNSSSGEENNSENILFAKDTDRVAFVGPNEMYFNVLLSPFTRSISISQGTTDWKCVDRKQLLEWLGTFPQKSNSNLNMNNNMKNQDFHLQDSISSSSSNSSEKQNYSSSSFVNTNYLEDESILRKMTEEMTFLVMLCQGHGGYELTNIPQLGGSTSEVLQAYLSVVLSTTSNISSSSSSEQNENNNSEEKDSGEENNNNEESLEGEERSNKDNNFSSSSSQPKITYKNDFWLFEREYSGDTSFNVTVEYLNQKGVHFHDDNKKKNSDHHHSSSSNLLSTLSSSSDPSTQIIPHRFGLNAEIFRQILSRIRVGALANSKSSSSSSNQHQITIGKNYPGMDYFSHLGKFSDTAAYLDSYLQIFHCVTLGEAPLSGFFLPQGFAAPSIFHILEYLTVVSNRSAPLPGIIFPAATSSSSSSSSSSCSSSSNKNNKNGETSVSSGNFDNSRMTRIQIQTQVQQSKNHNQDNADDNKKSSSSSSSTTKIKTVFVDQHSPLTAAEYGLLSCSSTKQFSDLSLQYSGKQISQTFAEKVAEQTKSIPEALYQIRRLLMFANPNNAHRALCHSPSICLIEVAGKSPEVEAQLKQEQILLEEQQQKEKEEMLEKQQSHQHQGDASSSSSSSQSFVAVPVSSAFSATAQQQQSAAANVRATKARLSSLQQRSHWRMFPVDL